MTKLEELYNVINKDCSAKRTPEGGSCRASARHKSPAPESGTDLQEEAVCNPSMFYQMRCLTNHYYVSKFMRQLPVREVEGFYKVQMRHTTSKFKLGKRIQVLETKKPEYVQSLTRTIQILPPMKEGSESLRSELLQSYPTVIRLPRSKSCSSSFPSDSCLPEAQSPYARCVMFIATLPDTNVRVDKVDPIASFY